MMIRPRRPESPVEAFATALDVPADLLGGEPIDWSASAAAGPTVNTLVRRGLWCDRCGQHARTEWSVLGEPGAPPIALLTGCRTCRSGMYAEQP